MNQAIIQEQIYKGLDAVINTYDSSKNLFDTASYKLYSAFMTLDSKLDNVISNIPEPTGDMGGYLDGPKGIVPLLAAGLVFSYGAVCEASEDKKYTSKNNIKGLIGCGIMAWQAVRAVKYGIEAGAFDRFIN